MASVASVPAYMLPGTQVIQQPRSNMDAGDPSLATEILPGPPSLFSVQQAAVKRDPRKPTPLLSYLPLHDPGTTYSGVATGPLVGSLEANPEVDGPRRKRARVDKGLASQRDQRASARNLNGVGMLGGSGVVHDTTTSVPTGHSDPMLTVQDSDDADVSRSNSVSGDPELSSVASKSQRRDKGKGKERATMRVKEEPSQVALQLGDLTSIAVHNEDHCSACRSLGSLVYCDGCPRAYHLWCLNPPMEASDLPEGENRWYCQSCRPQPNPAVKTSVSIMTPLINQIQNLPPVEFQLPEEIRSFFKHVGSSSRGTYLDTSMVKPPRLNRHGQLEDRDPYRTKDRNGLPVLCFQCGGSALPEGVNNATSIAKRPRRVPVQLQSNKHWRAVVSCDYCNLHWHLDCLDPPLLVMPPFDKKWMCPNHAENTFRPKSRIPKQASTPIDVTKPGQANNGMIEIMAPDSPPSAQDKVTVDEVFINGRRYRVPERIIKLDFWNKVQKDVAASSYSNDMSRLSSPLTSLSSLDEHGDGMKSSPLGSDPAPLDVQDVRLALMLLGISRTSQAKSSASHARIMVDESVQTSTMDTSLPPRAEHGPQAVNDTKKITGSLRPDPPSEMPSLPMNTSLDSAPMPQASERKQPARASKKDISYAIPNLDTVEADEIKNASSIQKNASALGTPLSSDVPKAKKNNRSRHPRHSRSSLASDNISTEKPAQETPTSLPPTSPLAPQKLSADPASASNAPSTPSSTLKIRLPPRSSMVSSSILPGSASSSRSTAKSRVSGHRRSLRRQTSVAASSSTSVSKLDGTSKAETPT